MKESNITWVLGWWWFCFCFETASHYIVLASLELAMWIRPALGSEKKRHGIRDRRVMEKL